MNSGVRKAVGFLGVAMMGDAIAYALGPKRYIRIWACPKGPRWYKRMLDIFANKRLGIVLGALEAALGLAALRLAERA